MKLIDADARVTVQSFDPMNEEYNHDEMTVEQALDFATDEGCPPTIDAIPVVHARWIEHKDEHQCSECREFTIVDFYVWKNMPFDYCPNCGAKMDLEEHDVKK